MHNILQTVFFVSFLRGQLYTKPSDGFVIIVLPFINGAKMLSLFGVFFVFK